MERELTEGDVWAALDQVLDMPAPYDPDWLEVEQVAEHYRVALETARRKCNAAVLAGTMESQDQLRDRTGLSRRVKVYRLKGD